MGCVNLQRPNFFSQKNLIYRRLISELGIRASAATKPQIKYYLEEMKKGLKREIAIVGSGLDFQLILEIVRD